MDVLETCVPDSGLLDVVLNHSETVAEFLAAFLKNGVPRLNGILAVGRTIITIVPGIEFAGLDVTAGLAASVSLSE